MNVELVAYGDCELFNCEFKNRQFLIAGEAENNKELGVLSFELVGFADFELFNVELTDNSQLQIQKILMREAH